MLTGLHVARCMTVFARKAARRSWIAVVCAGIAPAFAQAIPVRLDSPDGCESFLSVGSGQTYVLPGDQSYDCVSVASGGVVDTQGHVLTVSGVDGLLIKAGGKVYIRAGGELRFTAESDTLGHTIGGQIRLTDPTSRLSVQRDTVLRGTGSILGQDPESEIIISPDRVLTNALAGGIHGQLTVVGLHTLGTTRGSLRNTTLVEAESGVLTLSDSAVLSDTALAEWRAGEFGTLRFMRMNLALAGDFSVGGLGVLMFNADTATTGDFACDVDGYVEVDEANGVAFTYRYGDDGEVVTDTDCACLSCP